MIRTENLSKEFGNNRGIHDLNLTVPAGAIFGYIGPNGAGKTTTIQLLCGLTRPTAGKAFINDLEVNARNLKQIKRMIGYMPDAFGVYDQMTVWEYLDFFCAAYRIAPKLRKSRIDEVLELTNAAYMLDYQVSSLSKGMKQRIGLAKTMLHDPALLILDEPAAGLDPYARIEMRRTIQRLKELGKTILLSSHILPELASVCDLVGIIEQGKLLAQGTVREITENLCEHLVLVMRVDSDVDEAVDLCKRIENVDQVEDSGNELRLVFTGTRARVADLNALLVEHGVRINELKEAEVDLEQVFLNVTRKGDQ